MSEGSRFLRECNCLLFNGMSPAERVELALKLGDEDVTTVCANLGVTREEAVRRHRRHRQVGRRRSQVMEEGGT